jgi:hypothetical protein
MNLVPIELMLYVGSVFVMVGLLASVFPVDRSRLSPPARMMRHAFDRGSDPVDIAAPFGRERGTLLACRGIYAVAATIAQVGVVRDMTYVPPGNQAGDAGSILSVIELIAFGLTVLWLLHDFYTAAQRS